MASLEIAGLDLELGLIMGEFVPNYGWVCDRGCYFRGTYMLERDAPMPGVPWTTF